MAEVTSPEVLVDTVTFEHDTGLIHVSYALRSQQHATHGRDHVLHVQAERLAEEARELWEAAVALVEAYEVMEVGSPAQIPFGSSPAPQPAEG